MEHDQFEQARAEIEARIAAGRADGRYPETLDDELASLFARLQRDRLWFDAVAASRDRVAGWRGFGFSMAAVPFDSSLPGGAQIHRLVAKVVSRQVGGLVEQLNAYSSRLIGTLEAVQSALDELRAVLALDVFADIDALHARVRDLESTVAALQHGDHSSGA